VSPICRARFRIAAGMIVGDDHRCRIERQCRFDDFARVDRCTINGAVEEFRVLDQAKLGIQEQHSEHLVLVSRQLRAQVCLDVGGRSERCTASHLLLAGRAASRI